MRGKAAALLASCLHTTPVLKGLYGCKHKDRAGACISLLRCQHNIKHPQGPLSSSLALVGSSCRSQSLVGHIRFSSCNSNSTPTLACVTSCVIAHRPIVPPGHCHLPGGSHSVYCLLFTGNSQSVTHSTVRSPPKIPSSRLHIFSVLPSVSSRTSLNSFRVSKNS